MKSQPSQLTTAIRILTSISRNKGNQSIKFGQLIECNIRNVPLENHTQNVAEKLFPGHLLNMQNRAYL